MASRLTAVGFLSSAWLRTLLANEPSQSLLHKATASLRIPLSTDNTRRRRRAIILRPNTRRPRKADTTSSHQVRRLSRVNILRLRANILLPRASTRPRAAVTILLKAAIKPPTDSHLPRSNRMARLLQDSTARRLRSRTASLHQYLLATMLPPHRAPAPPMVHLPSNQPRLPSATVLRRLYNGMARPMRKRSVVP